MAPKAAAKATAKAAAAAPAPKKEAKEAAPKKERPEDKIPKVDQPDSKVYKEQIDAISEQVDALQKELKALSSQISAGTHGKEEFHHARGELRAELDVYSDAINKAREEKDAILKLVKGQAAEGKQLRSDLNGMKKSMKYTDVESIDDRIASVEFKLWTESLTLKEEKKLLEEIKGLKKDKPKIAEYHQKEAEVTSKLAGFGSGGNSKERLDMLSSIISENLEKKKAVNEKYSELMKKREEQTSGVSGLFEKRDELNKQIQEKIKERNGIRDEMREKERAYNAYLAEVRAARAEVARAEREARNKEYEAYRLQKEVDKLDEQPHGQEITLLEQTMKWCKAQLPKEAEAKEEVKETKYETKEGELVLLGKGKREEEFYYAPTKKAKASKAKGKKDGAATGKPIKHNAETFKLFSQLKLDAPITTDDIAPILKELEQKMAGYEEKIKEWEANREELKRKILEGGSLDDLKKEEQPVEAEEAGEADKEEEESG